MDEEGVYHQSIPIAGYTVPVRWPPAETNISITMQVL